MCCWVVGGVRMILMIIFNLSVDWMIVVDELCRGVVYWVFFGWVDLGGKGINVVCALFVYGIKIVVVVVFGGVEGDYFVVMFEVVGIEVVGVLIFGLIWFNVIVVELDGMMIKFNEFGVVFMVVEMVVVFGVVFG